MQITTVALGLDPDEKGSLDIALGLLISLQQLAGISMRGWFMFS